MTRDNAAWAALRRIARRLLGPATATGARPLSTSEQLLRLTMRDSQTRLESAVVELHRLRALGFGHPERDRPDYRYLFLLTYGRSGSTLLQGVLTHVPGYLIRGENGGVVYDLFRFHSTAMRHRERLTAERQPSTLPLTPQHPWWGIDGYPDDLALRELRALVLDTLIRPTPDARVLGFKEIRWGHKDLPEYIEFLRAVFPGARFVVNTRDLDATAASKWWADRPDARTVLEQLDRQVREAAAALGDDAFHVHYDDYKDDPQQLKGLFEWLPAKFNVRQIEAIMSQPHSY